MRKRYDYWKAARQGSFVHTYMEGYKNVETATSYDFWGGCWLLSNAIGRELSVARPYAQVYLNLYTILCAEAGITRKSTAVRQATTILRRYHSDHDEAFSLITGGISPEALDEQMGRLTANYSQARVAISSSELVSLLGRERYTSALPGKLTDLYDCPALHTRSTVKGGDTTARNVYPTLIAASTPSWLIRAVNPDVIEGGFTSRCLFIVEDKPKKLVAWPDESDYSAFHSSIAQRLANVRREAAYVAERERGIRPTRHALQVFREWYEGRTLSTDPYTASFQAREDHHILRVAGLLSASEDIWEIHENHMNHAISIIADVRACGMALFSTGMHSSRTYALVDRIRSVLVSAGRTGVTQQALGLACRRYGTLEQQNQVMNVMHEMNLVQRFALETAERGRPATVWRATRSLVTNKALEDIMDVLVPQQEV